MIKVLILAYDFPPYVSVGGQRPYSWYKYFKNFGVEPVVITRQWSNAYGNALDFVAPSESLMLEVEQNDRGTILRTPYRPTWRHSLLLKYGPKRFQGLYLFYNFTFLLGRKGKFIGPDTLF